MDWSNCLPLKYVIYVNVKNDKLELERKIKSYEEVQNSLNIDDYAWRMYGDWRRFIYGTNFTLGN